MNYFCHTSGPMSALGVAIVNKNRHNPQPLSLVLELLHYFLLLKYVKLLPETEQSLITGKT